MDWWRAKLLLIAAFLLLDLFLARQVWRLRGFTGPGAAQGDVLAPTGSTSTPGQLPELEVHTVGWQESWLGVLTQPSCNLNAADRQISPTISCTSNIDGAQLHWYNGLLIYNRDRPLTKLDAAEGEARRVISLIQPTQLPDGQLSLVSVDTSTETRTFVLVARYEDAWPLFNARWTITAGPQGMQAQRWWIEVKGPVPGTEQPLISAMQATAAVGAIYGQQSVSTVPAQLGYYYPHPQPPVLSTGPSTGTSDAAPGGQATQAPVPWYVKPVYMVRVDQNECVYVDAWAGEIVGNNDC